MVNACLGERLRGTPEALVRRICTDSRAVQVEDLFIALKGERFDGHSFLAQVASKRITGALVDRTKVPEPLPPCGLIAVPDTRTAFGQMAAHYRRDFELPVVAVAGSNGKTTTKEILATVLRQKFKTLSSPASFNNDIGVPTTLFELSREHQIAVLEFGSNHPGELDPLLRIAQPQFGVLTSIGREHLEFFGDLAGVIREEGSLAQALPHDGKLFLNGDTPGADDIVRRSTAPVVLAGFGDQNQWRARHLRLTAAGTIFQVEAPLSGFNREFEVALLGKHQVVNALLAIALAAELGLTPEEVDRGLRQCQPVKGRLQLCQMGGVEILDDSYNANADSMRTALDTLRDMPCTGRRVAVLGEMAELGVQSAPAHVEIGRYAALVGIHRLFTVGKMAAVMAEAARGAGLTEVLEFKEVPEAGDVLRRMIKPGDLVLLKASRACGLERIKAHLTQARADVSGDDRRPGPDLADRR